jgi:hypothetical protein
VPPPGWRARGQGRGCACRCGLRAAVDTPRGLRWRLRGRVPSKGLRGADRAAQRRPRVDNEAPRRQDVRHAAGRGAATVHAEPALWQVAKSPAGRLKRRIIDGCEEAARRPGRPRSDCDAREGCRRKGTGNREMGRAMVDRIAKRADGSPRTWSCRRSRAAAHRPHSGATAS